LVGHNPRVRITPVGIAVVVLLAVCAGLVVLGSGTAQLVGLIAGLLIVIVIAAEGVTVGPFIADETDYERKAELALRDGPLSPRPPVTGPAETDEELWARERERRRRLADERGERS
jgi:predicted cobalt transporter CbtA